MHPQLLAATPKVDASLLLLGNSSTSSPEADQELGKLKRILSICGYVQLVNHGIETSFLDQLCDVSKRFFALPQEEKQKLSIPSGFDAFLNDRIPDLDHTLCLDFCTEDQRTVKAWPEHPKDLRKVLLEFSKKLQKLNEMVLKAMAKSLNLEEKCFLKQYGESPSLFARFDSHSPQLTVGHGVNPSALNFIVQENMEAIEIQIDDQWLRNPLTPHALLVIVGDQAEIMSNGIFKSRLHKLVATSADEEWVSMSVFCSPDKRNNIEPAEELVDENRPRLYKNVVDYTGAFFQEIRHRNQRLIDALNLKE